MNSRTSGWSLLRTTIFAARRVVPPDLIDPATESAPRMNDTGPLAYPPPERCSLLERIVETLTPEPEPPLKMTPSVLNQTGELNDACCMAMRYFSSSEKMAASSLVAKYPPSVPHRAIVSTTRSTICLTLVSRAGVPSLPRKYFDATTFVAVIDQNAGTSTPFCSKTFPLSPGIAESRRSNSISSYGWTPA